jgi:hypothetical protein
MAQAAQIAGALLILAAYVLAQFGLLDQRSYSYLWLNLVGRRGANRPRVARAPVGLPAPGGRLDGRDSLVALRPSSPGDEVVGQALSAA